jgi:hypothetical protein
MLNAVECLAKAANLDALALDCVLPEQSADLTQMADCWRRNAIIARQQEAWIALHPLSGDVQLTGLDL